jgi:hypothetical protein
MRLQNKAENIIAITTFLHQWCLHLIVVVRVECSWDPESYASSSTATDKVIHAGQVKR